MSDSLFENEDFDSFAGEPSGEFIDDSAVRDPLDGSSSAEADTPPALDASENPLADAASDVTEESEASVAAATVAGAAAVQEKKSRFSLGNVNWSEMTVYDSMLMVAVLCVSLAILLLFFELRTFSNFPFGGFPWATPGFE